MIHNNFISVVPVHYIFIDKEKTTHMAVYSCICSWLYFGDLSLSSCHLVPPSPAAEASATNDTVWYIIFKNPYAPSLFRFTES